VIEQKIMSEDEFWDSKSWMLDDKATSRYLLLALI
jgi:hypothetical protein